MLRLGSIGTAPAALALLGGLSTAQTVVLPSAAAIAAPVVSGSPIAVNASTFFDRASHTQLLYDAGDIALGAAQWTALRVRPSASYTSPPATPYSTLARISLASSPLVHTDASPGFAANLAGPNTVTVFAGQLTLSARLPATWPTPWDVPVLFSTPYPFVRAIGKSLVVDIVQQGPQFQFGWLLELTPPDFGTVTTALVAGAGCALSNGAIAATRFPNPTAYPGCDWSVTYLTQPAIAPSVSSALVLLGVLGPGQSWNGWQLPIDLLPYGAPGCSFAISADAVMPLTQNGASFGFGMFSSAKLTIPNDPSLGGSSFYDQPVLRDPAANPLGLVTGIASRSRIGTLAPAAGTLVEATGLNAATITGGTVRRGYATTIRLD